MTKDQWLILRNQQELPMSVWFEYYRENGGLIQDFNDFVEQFSLLLLRPRLLSNGRVIHINLATAWNRISKYYNKKFDGND